jgi:hypothetical protein
MCSYATENQSESTNPAIKRNLGARLHLGSLSCPDRKGKELGIHRASVKPDFGKTCSMAFDGLTDAAFPAVQLDGSLDSETTRVLVARDAYDGEPLVVRGDTIVDDLITRERNVTVKDLGWRVGACDAVPVIDGALGDDAE